MRVRVIGAGVIGLTSALRLAEAGHAVEVVAAAAGELTTSSVAAALWYPYRALPEAAVTRWAARSYRVFAELADDPATGVRIRLGRELFRRPTPDPWWRPAVPELGRVSAERLPAGFVDGYQLSVPVIDMAVHLTWLQDRLIGLGVRIRYGQLTELALAGADVLVNCTGLGARDLVGDRTLVPVRGQVIVLEQFGLTEWLLDQDDPQRLNYIVPRTDTVLVGGTAEDGDEDLTVRPDTATAILARCAKLIPGLDEARVLAHRVGLRPARPSVRLETEFTEQGPVVHCYGHGGAGVTLSYGCAEDVVSRTAELA